MNSDKLSLDHGSLKEKLFVAFSLTSVIPLLTMFLVWNILVFPTVFKPYFPYLYEIGFMASVILMLGLISVLGLRVIYRYVYLNEASFLLGFTQTPLGLHSDKYLKYKLEEEARRAVVCHRSCAFALLSIDKLGCNKQTLLKKIAGIIKDNLSEVDKAAKFADNQFAILLPEKNKKEGLELSFQIKKKIDLALGFKAMSSEDTAINISVSECPIDGRNAEELIKAVRKR